MGKKTYWGKSLHLDLGDCNPKNFGKFSLKKFCKLLCVELGMEQHGPARVKRFGLGKLRGNSALQFIKTSSVSVHTDEFKNRVFVDIFSCKEFDESSAKKFVRKYFGAKTIKPRVLIRS